MREKKVSPARQEVSLGAYSFSREIIFGLSRKEVPCSKSR